jgi:hypothetical protein
MPPTSDSSGISREGNGPAVRAAVDAVNLAEWLTDFTAPMSPSQPYREPAAAENTDAVAGLWRLLGDGHAEALLGPLGFTVIPGIDVLTGRPFVLAFSESPPGERAWAGLLVDKSTPCHVVIGCPHPVADIETERLGLALWQRIPGALLLVAGAHRGADGGRADPRNNPGALFHQLAVALLDAGLPHVQVHGFADASAPGFDVVLSPGATTVGAPITRVGDSLAAHSLAVARAWEVPIPNLSGRTNIQGRHAADAGAVFIHVEVSRTARATETDQVVDALAGADVAGTGWPGPILGQAVAGQFPLAVGSSNTTGTSPYGARTDHVHAGVAPDDPRLFDLRAPIPHAHDASDLTSGRLDPARTPLADPPTVLEDAPVITVDHTTSRSFAVTASGALEIGLSSATPADGSTVLLEVLASETSTLINFTSGIGIFGEFTPPFAIPVGKLGLFGLRYSARAGRWVLISVGVEK